MENDKNEFTILEEDGRYYCINKNGIKSQITKATYLRKKKELEENNENNKPFDIPFNLDFNYKLGFNYKLVEYKTDLRNEIVKEIQKLIIDWNFLNSESADYYKGGLFAFNKVLNILKGDSADDRIEK